jgi:hypothetical protein
MKYPDSNQLRKLIRGFCMRRQYMLFHFIIEDFSRAQEADIQETKILEKNS